MKPLDPKLLKHAPPARAYVGLVIVIGVVSAGLILAQCFLIAYSAAPVISQGKTLGDVSGRITALAAVIAARALLSYVTEALGHRAGLATIAALRGRVLDRAVELGPRWLAVRTTQTVTMVSRGLDALEPYFVAYLPQLFLCVTVTPATLLVIGILDLPSALLLIFCIPLIPVFMILIGKMTAATSKKKLETMERLGDQVLDLIAGLPTLKALGREQGPKHRVAELGENYTAATMSALRIAFLSGTVLEFLAILSTALVAVEVGFRMVYGLLDLPTGLVIIMLTPEVFKPLREVGSQFHASADGVAAAEAAFEILEVPAPAPGTTSAPDLSTQEITLRDLSVEAPGRGLFAPSGATGTIRPGEITALRGASGGGKTTTILCLLGLVTPTEGTASCGGIDIADIDREAWWSQITWVPQRPVIPPGTLAEYLGEGDRQRAAALTGFDEVLATLPHGWDSVVGQGGVGLSVGQRQRLALTRALMKRRPLLILDEPTAHLDAASEGEIIAAVRAARDAGMTVVVIAHRDALLEAADTIIDIRAREVAHADA
ncbi:MAG: thiol reductant ABC exporter subunit CydD [Flaviflexus sp.]|nr:thiol reductant ABC exporter subunit CydD [Flaviflexus sp.]